MIFPRNRILDFLARSAIGILIGLVFALILGEGSFAFLGNKESVDREPQRVTLVIPYGTAKEIESGSGYNVLPTDLVLVDGDILVVKNEDVVAHQLGPIWVPPSSSGVLALNGANQYSYQCTFQPTRYQGIDVRPRLDVATRVEGFLAIALPTGMMLAVYSYLLPGRKKQAVEVEGERQSPRAV